MGSRYNVDWSAELFVCRSIKAKYNKFSQAYLYCYTHVKARGEQQKQTSSQQTFAKAYLYCYITHLQQASEYVSSCPRFYQLDERAVRTFQPTKRRNIFQAF
eukprot:TRINITY_DN19271_c0_g1_i1.p1 TRINITY_DN19271_c0_g1~~TRINITY_DN19271_c0_g1_i1.p1  ORF type:complete len:102 (-),score=2.74 TRINITY_DN19271_c0_g1_i1:180-485(-)